ncbi:hypothetical protein PHLCEN_2v12711 [Hermanssonia centrifuga]|uniref:Uncharacterized protein n=1 Tax=Hermanssonia centrifuga TaxID=98765 RepID=A0A2R6NGD4_9APHY|nr:hypothetical protein PHLCEN_2v12711 [Hermanssonia centrifuga]
MSGTHFPTSKLRANVGNTVQLLSQPVQGEEGKKDRLCIWLTTVCHWQCWRNYAPESDNANQTILRPYGSIPDDVQTERLGAHRNTR